MACFQELVCFLRAGRAFRRQDRGFTRPGERKLYKVLKKLEHRTNKTITENDWYMLVDGGKNERQVPSFYKYFAPYIQKARRWPRQRWNTKAYLADKSGFYRPISTQGCWLSFRYAAGLQDYTADDLVALGIELLKGIRILVRIIYASRSFRAPRSRTPLVLTAYPIPSARNFPSLIAQRS